jgi:hypothetical protein
MMRLSMREDITPAQVRTARLVAAAADLLQIVLLPAFFPGSLSPAADVIDVVVALVMLRLIGWHWAFLPTFVVELVPFVDLIPTWTAAVFFATRNAALPAAAPEVVVEPPTVSEPRALPAGRQTPPDSSGS